MNFQTKSNEFNQDQLNTIAYLRLICSIISVIGCLFIVILYMIMCFKHRCKRLNQYYYKIKTSNTNLNGEDYSNNTNSISFFTKNNNSTTFSQNNNVSVNKKMGLGNDLIFFLIISNLGWNFGSFIGIHGYKENDKDNPGCVAQAVIQNYFDMSSVAWNTIISFITLFGTQKCYSDMKKLENKLIWFMVYSWIIPFFLTLGPWLTDSYGPAGVWCWIKLYDRDPDFFIYFWITISNIFNWGNIFYSLYALIKTSRYFSQRKKEIGLDIEKAKEIRFLRKYIFILRVFPMVLLITRLFGSFNRFYSILISKENSYFLFILHAVSSSLQGFFNSIIFSYFYRSLLKCCHSKKEQNLNEVKTIDSSTNE